MKEYAANDCATFIRLYFHMFPRKVKINDIFDISPTITSHVKLSLNDKPSYIGEDKEHQILLPKFDKQTQLSIKQKQPQIETITKLSKSEKQCRKKCKIKM
ncbi:unnamed protein product [Rotaria sordida]|uniref:Uncharacterized protein n=1 Tax=Rotaria sordida TaxID=392033 RepID=A0A819ILW2_9BILA|nr:unnamed protein product [Rotaria sordida]CAF3770028.1 unnamed protein product [Rotaria sordida]CAF3915980.1 unnamed protein product [Rotaria sordida]